MSNNFIHSPPHHEWIEDEGEGYLDTDKDYYLSDDDLRPTSRLALPQIIQLRNRMCPWLHIRACPLLKGKEKDGVWRDYAGLSLSRESCIIISIKYSPFNILTTVCHEIWHECEKYMRNDILSMIDSLMLANGYGDPTYIDRPCERRARLFEHWCMLVIEGFPPRPASNQIDEIFQTVWNGAFADEICAPPYVK